MGGHEGWAQPSGFFPNGLLPNEAASVTQVLDPERWSQAEERTAELIACIQPNQASEGRRHAVASYVQRLITKCFSCQVFTFGSVPLKTYLPDGDIDLTVFSNNHSLKDNWANEVRDMLEREEKSEDAEFRVKEVQYIQAEVKIIKCLVENIVVDISFNQLGGLCTLCFLEEVNHLINQNHLFKRSIILIKAWCYYESRILGAHHGLISTYALETLVLYIFHVYNNSFTGPLEVLYRFLEFFSKFDWENFCVSLWGPVPICSLPDMTGEPPRRDGGDLLLSKMFLDACSSVYAVLPSGPENQEQPFVSKHFNVIDPLRTNNNLGRSVSKGNFFRIRSAFAFGAQRLARLLDCPKENLIAEVNQFFSNTWDRHGKGHRPDAPSPDLYGLRSLNLTQVDESDTLRNYSNKKEPKENSASNESEVDTAQAAHVSLGFSSRQGNHSLKRVSKASNVSAVSRIQNQKTRANLTSPIATDQNHQDLQSLSSNQNSWADKGRNFGPDNIGNELHAKFQFARTHSSPELTDTSTEVLSRGRHNGASETEKCQTASTRSDNSKRRNLKPEVSESCNVKFANDNLLPSRQSSSNCSVDATVDSDNVSNSYCGESGLRSMGKEYPSVADTMQMHQEEQDLVNMMASSTGYSFNGQVHLPMNLASLHPPHPIPPSILASLGYAHRSSAGMFPLNIPSFDSSWMHYPQDLVSFPGTQYFPNLGMASYREELSEAAESNLVSPESKPDDNHHGFWPKQGADSGGGYDHNNAGSRARQLDDMQRIISRSNSLHSSQVSSSDNSSLKDHGVSKENRGFMRENNLLHQRNRESDDHSTASSRSVPASQPSSSRTKLSSESNKDGSPLKTLKSTRDRRGRKPIHSTDPSIVYRLDKNGWDYDSDSVDHASSQADDDNQEWVSLSTVGPEVLGSMVPGSVASSHARTHQLPGYESAPINGSNSLLPVAPGLLGSGSGQKVKDNTGASPFTFYPTGPPVPFLTMLPLYNVPTETGTATASTNHYDRDEELINCRKSKLDNSLDSTENLDQSDVFNRSSSTSGAAFVESSEDCRSNILNGDFASHWQNLQYGRFCQNAQYHGSLLYPSSNAVPPVYLQGQFPWDGPGRPSANMNLLTQLMGYSPQLFPISPLQPGSIRPMGVYQHYADEIPRYRGGTGTYLPNPKISSRDRQSSNTRNHRGNYSYDRKDHHGDREGNWNMNSKSRFVGRGQGRNQGEKPSMRMDRSTSSNSRSNRSFKQDSFPSYHSRNSYGYSNSTNLGSGNVGYGMYPLPVVNPGGVSPSGNALPSIVMLYPYDQNAGYISPSDQLEFGSLGPMHFSGLNEASHLGEGSSRGEQRNFQVGSAHSSPDQPSSPEHHRRV